MPLAGGYSADKPVDDEVRALLAEPAIIAGVSDKAGQAVTSIEATSYSTQVVAGLNYKISAKINGNRDAVITIYKPLPHTNKPAEVTGIEIH